MNDDDRLLKGHLFTRTPVINQSIINHQTYILHTIIHRTRSTLSATIFTVQLSCFQQAKGDLFVVTEEHTCIPLPLRTFM